MYYFGSQSPKTSRSVIMSAHIYLQSCQLDELQEKWKCCDRPQKTNHAPLFCSVLSNPFFSRRATIVSTFFHPGNCFYEFHNSAFDSTRVVCFLPTTRRAILFLYTEVGLVSITQRIIIQIN